MEESKGLDDTPRVDLVPITALLGIISGRDYGGSDNPVAWNHQSLPFSETFDYLPKSLTVGEISLLGLRLSGAVEKMNPSRDAMTHGWQAESKATYLIGRFALLEGDAVTAHSSVEHLKYLGGLFNRGAAFVLSRSIKKSAESNK